MGLILISQACDIFESREPESPKEPKSSYTVPVVPSDVIENLKNAFKDKNANDYKKNFSSGPPIFSRYFYFVPSNNVANNFPPDWNVEQEFQYFNSLVISLPAEIPIQLTFLDEEYDLQADSAIYSAIYSISVSVENSVPVIYEGNLKFLMAQESTVWAIYYWEDIAKQGFKSWSELKFEFYL